MRASGYHGELAYDDHATDTRAGKRIRKRNIVCFNSPFSKSVKNNIAKEFLKLVDKPLRLTTMYQKYATAMSEKSAATVACPTWLQLYPATTKTFSVTNRSQRPPSLLATATTQRIVLSMENGAKRLSYTKPRLHLMAPPNIILGAPKRNSRPVITITPTPSGIERKEMGETLKSILECYRF